MKNKMTPTGKVVTFGELLMRLSPSENRKFKQANKLDFFFGGTEVNVAVSLATFDLEVQHVTNVSRDYVGDAAVSYLRQFGIDVSEIRKVDHPLGLYFLEVGSSLRSSQVSYNRLHGAFAQIAPKDIDWEKVFLDCDCFHWTGISPGISESAFQTLRYGLLEAKKRGVIVTADPAYRSNLWNYGKEGREVLSGLIKLSTVFLGGVNEMKEILGIHFSSDKEGFIKASKQLMSSFPSIEKVFDKVRIGQSASWQKIYGRAWNGEEYLESPEFEIRKITDRIGTGDAFAAGVIYGMKHYSDLETLEFATAACSLKHTILGDANLVSVQEIRAAVNGDSGDRIRR